LNAGISVEIIAAMRGMCVLERGMDKWDWGDVRSEST
jgi:hypothetical protein